MVAFRFEGNRTRFTSAFVLTLNSLHIGKWVTTDESSGKILIVLQNLFYKQNVSAVHVCAYIYVYEYVHTCVPTVM